jgi:glycosyltransferase involved in cell wall biosynthesis
VSQISIVIPVYNNAPSLPDLVTRFQELAIKDTQDQFEFVFVDDGSFDDSLSVLVSLAQRERRIRIVKLSRNFGSNAALLAGLSQARGEAVAAIAADLQDPPELILDLIQYWREGHKIVLAARQTRDDGLLNNLLSDTFYAVFRLFAIKTMPKRGFDFFLLDRQVCNLINNIQENNVYLMGLIVWLGFTPKVINYHRRKREKRYGRSMWTFARKIKYFIDSFVAFTYFPVRATSIIGLTFSVVGLLYSVVVVFLRLFKYVPIEGWASLMVVVLIVSGVQMMMMGILGEYLWRNLDETRKRPRFIIDRIIEHDADRTAPPMIKEN